MHRLIGLAACLVLVSSATAESTPSKGLAVDSAFADLEQEILLVSGRGFLPDTRVWLVEQGELLVLSVSPGLVEARLPQNVAPGTYRLLVSSKHRGRAQESDARTDSLDVTIGTVGPRGPEGLPGVPGLPGSPGEPGPRGAGWTSGNGAPDPTSGAEGDFYLDAENGDVYLKTAQTWNVIANLEGPEGPRGPAGAAADPLASLANRLGVHLPDVAVPLEALRSAQCGNGDSVAFRASDTVVGSVAGLWGREALNEPYEFHVLLRAAAGLSGSSFVGGDGEIRIETSGGNFAPKGNVTAFATLGESNGATLYLVTVRAKLERGDRSSGFAAFVDSDPSDVMQTILTGLGITPQVAIIDAVNDGYEVQYNESDLAFLKRLASETGAFFYTRDDGVVVVSTSNSGFEPGPSLPYLGPFADGGSNTIAVSSFASGDASTTRGVTVTGWDYVAKETVEAQSGASGGADVLFYFDALQMTTAAAERRAQQLDARARVEANTRQGTSNAPGVRAGRQISISSIGAGSSGSYYVTSVQHVLHEDEDTGCFAYANQFTAVPSSIPYRPARATHRPRVSGLQSALVTDNVDPDELGRIKVRFPWTAQGVESNWARVLFAAGGESQWLLPDVDDEVLVGFIGGDPRAPVILGGLFNGKDKPPTQP